MKTFTENSRLKLIESLTKENELYKQFYELTKQQNDQVKTEKLAELNKSLNKRQELIDKINGLHQDTKLLMQSYMSAGKPDAIIEKLQASNVKILKESQTLDTQTAEIAQKMSITNAEQSEKLRHGRKGLGLYNQKVEYGSEFFDKKT